MVKSFENHKRKLDEINAKENSKFETKVATENSDSKDVVEKDDEPFLLDTVGAIVLDSKGNFASAVSSGGILLKHPGRVGHSAMFGCGCWVEEEDDFDENNEKGSIAICTTGSGK